MYPPAKPGCDEVLLTVGEGDQIVTVERKADVGARVVRIGCQLDQVVDSGRIQTCAECDVEITDPAQDGAIRDVLGPQCGIDAVDRVGELVERRAALLERRHNGPR